MGKEAFHCASRGECRKRGHDGRANSTVSEVKLFVEAVSHAIRNGSCYLYLSIYYRHWRYLGIELVGKKGSLERKRLPKLF